MIKNFAHFCGLSDYDPKEFRLRKNQIEAKAKPKRELTDKEIETWFNRFPEWIGNIASPSQWRLWQWMYGMQAAYGFRNHETLNIFNLDQRCVNVKSHHAGIPASIIAKNLGHTLAMNQSVYLESEGLKSCLETLKIWEENQNNEADKKISIEQQLEALKQENKQLKALLQNLLESIKTEK